MRIIRVICSVAFDEASAYGPLLALSTLLVCSATSDAEKPPSQGNAELVSGTWVLQQASSIRELEAMMPRVIEPALQTPHLRGFCLRFPWKAADKDFSLLERGLQIARQYHLEFSVRFMAGRHSPPRVFEKEAPFYTTKTLRGEPEKVPAPFYPDGSPNLVFEKEYDEYVGRLAQWCRTNGVHLLHLAWYGQDWAELNHGKEVRALPGYTEANWQRSHLRLIDIGLKHAGEGLAVELPFSGHGPCSASANVFADYIVKKIGPSHPLFFCQANGWGPQGDWGAPTKAVEASFDAVCKKKICRGEQMIQPGDYDWPQVFQKLYENTATYCEVYAPSFSAEHKKELAAEIEKFAAHVRNKAPLP